MALGGALWALGRPLTGKRVKVDEDVKVVKVDEDVKVVQSGSKFFKAEDFGKGRLALGAWRGALGAGQAADGEKGEGG